MKMKGKQEVEVEVSHTEIGYALAKIALEMCGLPEDYDDAGCDWSTTNDGRVIIGGDIEWVICKNRKDIVAVVDAMNIVHWGNALKFYDKEQEKFDSTVS